MKTPAEVKADATAPDSRVLDKRRLPMKGRILWSIGLRRSILVFQIAGSAVGVLFALGVLMKACSPVFQVLTEGEALIVTLLLLVLAVGLIIKIAKKILAVG